MATDQARHRLGQNLFFVAGIAWLLLSAWAFWAYYSGSAPFDTLGIPISQLVLAFIFIWLETGQAAGSIGWRPQPGFRYTDT